MEKNKFIFIMIIVTIILYTIILYFLFISAPKDLSTNINLHHHQSFPHKSIHYKFILGQNSKNLIKRSF